MKNIVRTSTKYIINGREYHSLEEMPETDRKFFEDANKNGIPDGFENLLSEMKDGVVQKTEAALQHREVVVSNPASEAGAGLDREAIRKMLGAGESKSGAGSEIPAPRQPSSNKPTVTFSLDLKTLVIVLLLGVIAVLIAVLVFKSR